MESVNPAIVKPKIYVETSVISYMTARPSSSAVTLARQQSSIQLWQAHGQFDFFISEPVLQEISAGNEEAAQIRMAYVASLISLRETTESLQLTKQLIQSRAVPETSYLDATHIALAAVHGMDYIASWNFKHIAGAFARNRITNALRELGFKTLTIHTPDELIEGEIP